MIDLKEVFKQQPACETDSKKLKAVLNDLYPEDKVLTKILVDIFDSGIASEIKGKQSIDGITIDGYKTRLEDVYGYSPKYIKQALDIVLSAYGKQNNSTPASAPQTAKETYITEKTQQTQTTKIIAKPNYNLADFEIEDDVLTEYKGKGGNVVIPDGVTSIGVWAFEDCRGLTSVTIGSSVTSIGERAFSRCSGLTSITIPDSVTSIGEEAFLYCSGLTSITVASGNRKYHSVGNCIIETATNTLIVGCKNSIIPDDGSVTSIGYEAFRSCWGLTSITIPDSVTSIGKYAFFWCSVLRRITIPDSVKSIGDSAFSGCSGLKSITYKGTKSHWNSIKKGNGWKKDVPTNCIVLCTDGNIHI